MEVDDDVDNATSSRDSLGVSAFRVRLGKNVGYMEMMNDILEGLRQEVDSAALQELQILCSGLSLDINLKSELMSKKTLLEVYGLLLKHTNNDFRQIIQIMNEFVPKIICDLHPELLKKMRWLNDTIARENKCFGLTEKSTLYGREDKLDDLLNFVNLEKYKDTLLINVCGMAGIGKSFLVKHLGSRLINRGKHVVVYVDASGVSHFSEFIAKILENSQVAAGNPQNSMRPLFEFMLQNSKSQFVFIIDDLSTLISASDVNITKQLFSFLNEFVERSKKKKLKLKLVVTSQIHFKMTSQTLEENELVAIKRKMDGYTKDVALTNLSNEASLKFLGSFVESDDRELLIKLCDGHPLSLCNISTMAELGFSCTTEITKISPEDVDYLEKLNAVLFQKAFDRLSDEQRDVLLAVALFDRDAQLGALYKIVNSRESRREFYSRVKREFSKRFWITFLTCDVTSETDRKILVNFHHPLIRRFVSKKITSYLDDVDCPEHRASCALKRRYIEYHVSELINVGRECVQQDTQNKKDYVAKTCTRFIDNISNFSKTLIFVQSSEDLCLLFSTGPGSEQLRHHSDIVHLFLSLHLFYDSFHKGLLMDMLQTAINWTISEPRQRVLIWALYVMVLVVDQDWKTLESVLQHYREENDPKLISSTPDLYSFCRAMYGYATGALYTNSVRLKACTSAEVLQKRNTAFKKALGYLDLKYLTADWIGVRNYFAGHVLLVQAESSLLNEFTKLKGIKDALSICKKAKKCTQHAQILEPEVLTKLAAYKSMEGDQYGEVDKATEKYHEASFYYDKAQKQFASIKMEHTVKAARCLNSHAVHLRSWATLLIDECGSPKDLLQAAIMLKQARGLGEEAIDIFECASILSPSLRWLYLVYGHQGACCFTQAECCNLLNRDSPEVYKYQTAMMRYYNKAYNLLKDDYRRCHLSVNDYTLDDLIERLPQSMASHGHRVESVDKVRNNLKTVKAMADAESGERIDLSGSELYSSSEGDLSEEDPVSGKDEQSTLATTNTQHLAISEPSTDDDISRNVPDKKPKL